jgi:hypothetical protein
MELFLFRAVGPLLTATSILLVLLVVPPLVLYVIARWRAHRDGIADPQLGLKCALYYFATSALQLGLAGVALLIYQLISPSTGDKGAGYRAAIGFIIPAGLVLVAHVGLLKRTNDEQLQNVRRLFYGFTLIVTGLIAFFALVLGFQALFAKGSTHGVGHTAGSMIVVYGAAWALIGYKYGQLVLPPGGGSVSSAGPGVGTAEPLPYHPPVPTPPSQTQTGLPVLGGGSYPPIEPPK